MKIGFGQINTIVGDLTGNRDKILKTYNTLCKKGADLVVFPELVITGYAPRDLLNKSHFVEDNEKILEEIAQKVGKVPAVVGFVQSNPARKGTPFYNAIAWCEEGAIKDIGHKCLLPSYGVFEEDRYFQVGDKPKVIEWQGKRIGLTICEDIWTGKLLKSHRKHEFDPVKFIEKEKVDLVLNISASPWNFTKTKIRKQLISNVAKRCKCPVVYCNHIGGNDELIFDGRSLVADKDGHVRMTLTAFEEDLSVLDLETLEQIEPEKEAVNIIEEIHNALVLGLRDYAQKCGFNKVIIGLSGGIDSAVVTAIAVGAMGKENVLTYGLPSAISRENSVTDAKELAKQLEVSFEILPINDIIEATERVLAPITKGEPRGVTEENIQARARGIVLMGISNKLDALLIPTGNKSETAVGYCTLYGDMAGGLGILADVTKTKVYALAKYINREKKIIPQSIIDKPPSAELSPGQLDTDSLPPYEQLDPIVCLYIEKNYSTRKIIEMGYDEKVVIDIVRKIDLNEYKRQQAAPTLKITPLAFGIGRRMPIVQKYVS